MRTGNCLPRHRALHLRWKRDVFDLHRRNVDAPLLHAGIEDGLHFNVDLGPLGQDFIQLHATDDRTQRGRRQLQRRRHVLLYPQHRIRWGLHIGIDHCIHPNRDVVACNDLLGRNLDDLGPQIDDLRSINPERKHQHQSRAKRLTARPTESEHDRALVFAQYLQAGGDKEHDREETDRYDG